MDGFIPTNTLACANFDVLKMDAIEDPLININKLATMDFEESYFNAAIDFINECNTEITDKKIAFYGALNEAVNSSNEVAVLESFTDYFTGVKDVIAKIIKFLRSLVDRFIIALNKFFKSDTYLTKHLKELDGFSSDDDFSFYGYEYTFSPSIPYPQAILAFNANLFSDIAPSASGNELSLAGVKQVTRDMDLESQCDTFRAQVLGKDGKIYYTEYPDELFMIYRNGDTNTVQISADSSYIHTASRRYKEYDKTKKAVEKQRTEIEKAYEQVQKDVQAITRSNGSLNVAAFLNNINASGANITGINQDGKDATGLTMSGDMMATVDAYIKAKIDQLQELSNIHIMAFSSKLDAISECFKQDRIVLYSALSRVNKSGNARKEEKRR